MERTGGRNRERRLRARYEKLEGIGQDRKRQSAGVRRATLCIRTRDRRKRGQEEIETGIRVGYRRRRG